MPRKVAPHLDPVVVLVHRPGLAVRIEGLPFAVLLAVRPPGDLGQPTGLIVHGDFSGIPGHHDHLALDISIGPALREGTFLRG